MNESKITDLKNSEINKTSQQQAQPQLQSHAQQKQLQHQPKLKLKESFLNDDCLDEDKEDALIDIDHVAKCDLLPQQNDYDDLFAYDHHLFSTYQLENKNTYDLFANVTTNNINNLIQFDMNQIKKNESQRQQKQHEQITANNNFIVEDYELINDDFDYLKCEDLDVDNLFDEQCHGSVITTNENPMELMDTTQNHIKLEINSELNDEYHNSTNGCSNADVCILNLKNVNIAIKNLKMPENKINDTVVITSNDSDGSQVQLNKLQNSTSSNFFQLRLLIFSFIKIYFLLFFFSRF
jgi:hypothetical protein